MNRRNFLRTATVATTALAGLPWKSPLSAENAPEKTNWPIMVEGVQVGATAAETTANARANREFLENVLAAI